MKHNSISNLLHNAGLKHTPGREALLSLLMTTEAPLTQEEISHRLTQHGLNRVSIYRALASFLKVGIVHRVESGGRVWKFAYCGCGGQGHCHPHFICRGCGRVECLSWIKLPEVTEAKSGYIIEGREFYLRGLCSECS